MRTSWDRARRSPRALLAELPDRLRQPAFELTGGLHATGLFDATGKLRLVREDVGRHNAMDKVIGRALLDGLLPLSGHVLCVTGRLSFELVQKAAVAGAPVLVGVGAPTSLAVELATDRGMTLMRLRAAGVGERLLGLGARVGRLGLDVLEAEPALDAEVAAGDVVVAAAR